VALVRTPQKAADLGVEAREANYDEPETLGKALQGIDTLLLISSSEIGKRAPQHKNVIEAAKRAGVNWIVYTSLLHADTSSLSLAAEHVVTEAALRESGIPFTLLRNGWYNENYIETIQGALASGAFIGSSGEGKVSAASRVDYAQAAVAVLTSEGQEGKVYELAGDEAFTLSDLAAEVSRQTGKNIPYNNLSETDYVSTLKTYGLDEGLSEMIAGLDISTSKGDLFDDSHQLSKLIGRRTTPISETVAESLKGQA
jgi:NAD(P)H dehydrogenase (quinone)